MKRKYITHTKQIPYLIVENFFKDEEVDNMLSEIKLFDENGLFCFQPGLKMEEGHKHNTQLGLDKLYAIRQASYTLTKLDEIFHDKKLVKKLEDMHWFYDSWGLTNYDSSFVTKFVEDDYYHEHRDCAVISWMYWLWEEPKSFTGGDVRLTDYNIEVPVKRNQLMIFPSSIRHSVNKIENGKGRYCVVRFLHILPANSKVESLEGATIGKGNG